MYQQIRALNTEEKALEISKMWHWIVQNATNEFQTALSDMNMHNQFHNMSVLSVKQFQKISKN
jgi:hypothetical protein